MAAITLPVGFVRVAWLAPNLTLSAATWKNNVNYITRENAARTVLVNFRPEKGVNAVTTLVQGEFYLFNVKTQFQLDSTVISLMVPLPEPDTLLLTGLAGYGLSSFTERIVPSQTATVTSTILEGNGTIQYSSDRKTWSSLPTQVTQPFFLRLVQPSKVFTRAQVVLTYN